VRNPEGILYFEDDAIYRRTDRRGRHKQQFDLDEQVVSSSDNRFDQPSDEDALGNIISIPKMDIDAEEDIKQTPNKADAKPPPEEEEQPSPSPESKEKRMSKHDAINEKMKKLFTTFT
jgi:hypothetical protein